MTSELNDDQRIVLDIIRITAAFLVVFGHSFSWYKFTVFQDETYFAYIQNIGVVLLFLISGFLAAYSINRKNLNKDYSFERLFKHRVFRIIREYYPALFLIAIIDFASIHVNGARYIYKDTFNVKDFIGTAFMLNAMGPADVIGLWFYPFGSGRQLWTLPVEFWVFLLFGFIYIMISNKIKVSFRQVLLLTVLISMCLEYLIGGRGNGLGVVFLLGVLAYHSFDLLDLTFSRFLLPFTIIVFIAYELLAKNAYTIYSFILLWVIVCSSLKAFSRKKAFLKFDGVIRFISKSSFMIYLLHYSIIDFIYSTQLGVGDIAKFWIGIIISILLSLGMYTLFSEKSMIGKYLYKIEEKGFKLRKNI